MEKTNKKLKRKMRAKSSIRGTKDRPRLAVFRSNRYIYAQVINDEDGKTIVGISEKHLAEKAKATKVERDKKVKKVVFDRRNYAYFGRVKEVALGAREGGLKF